MLSVLKLNLTFNQKCIKINLKNFQEPNWDEIIEEQKLEDDINKCREVLPFISYLAGYCRYAVFKNIKCNSCKDLISGRDNMEEIPEINSYFQRINRGPLLYPNDITVAEPISESTPQRNLSLMRASVVTARDDEGRQKAR